MKKLYEILENMYTYRTTRNVRKARGKLFTERLEDVRSLKKGVRGLQKRYVDKKY